jgi:hypothetical protein
LGAQQRYRLPEVLQEPTALWAALGVPLNTSTAAGPELAVQVRRHLPRDPVVIKREPHPLSKRAHQTSDPGIAGEDSHTAAV